MKTSRKLMFFMAMLMLFTSLFPSIAIAMEEIEITTGEGFGDFIPDYGLRSIQPGDESVVAVHEYRAYRTKEAAEEAKNSSSPVEGYISNQIIRNGQSLEYIEPLEIKDNLFLGWFTEDENGVEYKLTTAPISVSKDKIFYVYPKYEKTNFVYFISGNVSRGYANADNKGYISKSKEPPLNKEGHSLTGWYISRPGEVPNLEGMTAAEAANNGKLFRFIEDKNEKEGIEPTLVNGEIDLHAIFEPSVRVIFDSRGGTPIDGTTAIQGKVKIPTSPTKEGYTFIGWYIDADQVDGSTEKILLEEGNDGYFVKEFNKTTTIKAYYLPEISNYQIIFKTEKLPGTYESEKDKYEYFTYYRVDESQTLLPRGKSGSKLKIGDGESNNEITYLDEEKFKDFNNFAGENGRPAYENWEGFHVNVNKTAKEETVITGDGQAVFNVYLDRDLVKVIYYEGNNDWDFNVDFESTPHIIISDGLKYGQNLDTGSVDSDWALVRKQFMPGGEQKYQPVFIEPDGLVKADNGLIFPPFLTRKAGDKEQMTELSEDRWLMRISAGKRYGDIPFIGVPLEAPWYAQVNNNNLNQLQLNRLIDNYLKNNILNYSTLGALRLPNSENPLSGIIGSSNKTYLNNNDLVEFPGYGHYKIGGNGKLYGIRDYKDGPIVRKEVQKYIGSIYSDMVGGYDGNVNGGLLFWKRNTYNIDFKDTANGSTVSKKALYDLPIVGDISENNDGTTPTYGPPKVNPYSNEVEEFVNSHIHLKVDENGLPLNLEEATKNLRGEYFKGWYKDPGFQEKFEPENMKMPAKNIEIFSKWGAINYTVTFHKLYPKHPATNVDQNTKKVIVKDGYQVSEDEGVYELPIGKTENDFLGWYYKDGDIYKEFHFDTKIKQNIHLYPMWRDAQIRVVYVFNSKNPNELTREELEAIHLDAANEGETYVEGKYYISKYQYSMDNPIRLLAPLGYDEDDITVKHPNYNKPDEQRDFYSWKVGWKKKSLNTQSIYEGEWDTGSKVYYYNSPYLLNTNETTIPDVTDDDYVGMVFFFAQYRDKEEKTSLNIFPNIDGLDLEELKFDGISEVLENNKKVTLPSKETVKDLLEELVDDESLDQATKDKITEHLNTMDMVSFNEKSNGTGRTFRFGDTVIVDLNEPLPNNLYIRWKKKVHISLEKIWLDSIPEDLPSSINVGLLRRTGTSSVNHPKTDGFLPVPNSFRTIDGNSEWKVDDYFDLAESSGVEYYYLVMEVPEGKEEMFKTGYDPERDGELTWPSLGINITKQGQKHIKTQVIKHEVSPDQIDVYTSATTRSIIDNLEEKSINFEMTNKKVDIEPPNIDQVYNGDEKISVDVPSDKDIKKMIINVYDGQYEKGKTPKYSFEILKDNEDWKLDGELLDIIDNDIKIPKTGSLELNTNDEIHGKSFKTKEGEEVASDLDKVTVIPRDDSIKAEPPYQERRNESGKVIIKADIPEGVDPNAEYFLATGSDDIVKYILHDGKPLKGNIDSEDPSKIKFVIPLELEEGDYPQIYNGQKLRLVVAENHKNRSLSEESEPLDTMAPNISAEDIIGQVSLPLTDDQGIISISDNTEEGVIVNYDKVPNGLKFVKEAMGLWNITGTPTFDIEYGDYVTTVTATDKFGNKSEKEIRYTITNLDTLPPPIIKQPMQGDTEVQVKPPTKADRMELHVGNRIFYLSKNTDGQWIDDDNPTDPLNVDSDGYLNVNVDPLSSFEFIRAYGFATGYIDSPEVNDVVKPLSETEETEEKRRTDQPTLGEVKKDDLDEDGNLYLRIKPNDNATEIYVTYNKKDELGEDDITFKLLRDTDDSGLVQIWNLVDMKTGNITPLSVEEGYIKLDITNLKVENGDLFSATGKDNQYGKLTSYPTAVRVGLLPTSKPIVEKVGVTPDGKSTITGKGEPNSIIKVYDDNEVIGITQTDGEGNFTVIIDEKITTNKEVELTQKNGEHPESEKEKTTIVPAKEGPIIDTPTEGDTEVVVTPPEDSETVIINVPGEEPITIKKDKDGNWTDEDGNELEKAGDKLKVPTKPLKPGNVTAVGEDKDGNKTKITKETVIRNLDKPIIREPHEGDTSVTVIPPKSAEKIEVTIPGTGAVIYEKDGNENWIDGEGNVVAGPIEEIVIPTNPLQKGEVTAKATDKNDKETSATEKIRENLELPKVEEPHEGDTEIKVTPPSSAERIEVILPGTGETIIIEKDSNGNWIDEDGNILEKAGDKLVIPTNPTQPGEITVIAIDENNQSSKVTVPVKKRNTGDITFQVKDKYNREIFGYTTVVTGPNGDIYEPYKLNTPGEYKYKILYNGEELASDTFDVETGEVNTKVKVHVKLVKEVVKVPSGGSDGSSYVPNTPSKPETDAKKPGETVQIQRHRAYIFGYPDGTFGPERSITRGETAMILARIISGRNEFTTTDTEYPDVTKEMWHSGAIKYLADRGILTGYEDGLFKPENPITRAEFTTIIARYKSLSSTNNGKFNDVVGHWSEKFIFGVSDAGYISGYPDGSFRPNKNITRAEAVKIINLMLDRLGDREFIVEHLDVNNRFSDVKLDHWAFAHIYEASITHKFIREKNRSETWKIMEED